MVEFLRRRIPYKNYLKLIESAEAQLIDFKDKRIAPKKLSKTISALANADGGEIYVGITETEIDGETKFSWDGFDKEEEANQIVDCLEKMLYLSCKYTAEFLEHSKQGLVLRLIINKSNKVIETTEKKVYLRRNAQDLELKTSEEIHRLKLNKGVNSYEDFTKDVDIKEVTDSDIIVEFLLNNGFDVEPEDFLRKNNLVSVEEEEEKPRVSGLLLFCDYPQAFVERCGVKIIRYNTSSDVPERKDMVINPKTQEGCLYKLIYETVEQVSKIVDNIPSTENGDKVIYPEETLHEIITNAVLHRDYSVKDDIQIRIFNNRIEIESPGILPGHITKQNILNERYSRNGNLVRVINKFDNPPNKDIGEGLNTAFDAMRDSGLMYPRFESKENSVLVVIPNERVPDCTKVFLELLKTHGVLSSKDIERRKIFKSGNEQKKIIKQLKKDEIIETLPKNQGFNPKYRLVSSYKKRIS